MPCCPKALPNAPSTVLAKPQAAIAVSETIFSNEPSPLSNVHLPPPPVKAKLAWKDHLFLLYAYWKEGITGAKALPLKSLGVVALLTLLLNSR